MMSFLRYLGTNLIFFIAIIADVSAIMFLLRKPDGSSNGIELIYYSNLILSSFMIFLFIRLTYIEIHWGRKKRYALAFNILNQGFAEIHELERSENPETLKLISLEKFCDALAQTFNHITMARCGVCIKILSEHDHRLEVWTLVRDSASKNSRPMQEKDTSKNLHHWVDANTDFSSIMSKMSSDQKPFFCSNNLPWRMDYKNSRMQDDNKNVPNNFMLAGIVKMLFWPLSYRSSLVVPIVPGYFNSSSSEKLAGFLCIDSPQTGIFKKQYDLSIAQGVADGLYNVLIKYYALSKYNSH